MGGAVRRGLLRVSAQLQQPEAARADPAPHQSTESVSGRCRSTDHLPNSRVWLLSLRICHSYSSSPRDHLSSAPRVNSRLWGSRSMSSVSTSVSQPPRPWYSSRTARSARACSRSR